MKPELREQFPPAACRLGDGTEARVRLLSREDGPALAALYADVPREDQRFYQPHRLTPDKALENAALADDPRRVVLVMESPDGGLAGYAWYRWQKDDARNSSFGICVRPRFQSRGAGRCLMTRLLQIAATVGPPIMALTVQKANARALRLYRGMGFEPVREQIVGARTHLGYGPEPEYYMECRVREPERLRVAD